MRKITLAAKRVLTATLLVFICAGVLEASSQIYFGALAVRNQTTSSPMVLLEWGPVEGSVPEDIVSFNIYRKAGSGNFENIASVDKELVTSAQLQAFFNEPGEERQKEEIINWLVASYPDKNPGPGNFAGILHDILDPTNIQNYNSAQAYILNRFSRDIARAQGLAWLDRGGVPAGNVSYMITGVYADQSETGPLGRTTVDTTTETILPAPRDFRQVLVSDCSVMRRQIDHGRIHLNWDVPSTPEKMPLRILNYGYDIYRQEKPDSGTCPVFDLRTSISSDLVKINDIPVIASGNTSPDGPDSYLAIDEGEFLQGGSALEPGTWYCYYLVARDLSGNYSATAGPEEIMVPDMEGPVMPWGIEAHREMVTGYANNIIPRLTLVWDQVNNINYLNEYGEDKNICGVSAREACYVLNGESCQDDRQTCVDLDVKDYLVFRFDNFQDASKWGGADSDNDLWPDEEEIEFGTDKCDPYSHPTGNFCDQWSTPPCDPAVSLPDVLVARIPQDDSSHIRILDTGKTLMFFQDIDPQPDNQVYWYRVAARDLYGNLSILSPPIRAALWDRSQPEITMAMLMVNKCSYKVEFEGGDDCSQDPAPGVLSIIDETGQAVSFGIFEQCSNGQTDCLQPVYNGKLVNGKRELRYSNLDDELYSYCDALPSETSYSVSFYAEDGTTLATLENQEWFLCDSRVGCVTLKQKYEYVPVDSSSVHDPTKNVKLCVPLEEEQIARVYQETNGKMSPIATLRPLPYDPETCLYLDLESIVSANVCLGVRVFSKNSVGSAMYRLPCFTIAKSQQEAPEAPLIDSVKQTGDANNPSFTVTWGYQSNGLTAFILSGTADSVPVLETIWDPEPDAETHQFSRVFPIAAGDVNKKWCFKVKVVDKALQTSPWSGGRCKVWKQETATDSLKWPHISDLARGSNISAFSSPESGEITAFVLNGEKIPAVVLSKDLNPDFNALLNPVDTCEYEIGECFGDSPCSGSNTMPWNHSSFHCRVCGLVSSWNLVGDFVVYRQEEGRDFVQVSPLVDDLCCYGKINNEGEMATEVADPLIALVRLQADGDHHSVVGGGETWPTDSDLQSSLEGSYGTIRLIFLDFYPVAEGSRVRYKIVKVGSGSREPEAVYTSNWVRIPLISAEP